MSTYTSITFDYYPFGMVMPGRSYTSSGGDYRFGFNGMEKDGEDWSGSAGNQLDFGARIYDSRLGRWMSPDPKESKFPDWSTYNFAIDNPILFVDPDGGTVYVYFMDPKGVNLFGLLGHNAIGQSFNSTDILYFGALGNNVHTYNEEVYMGDGGMYYKEHVSEPGTMKMYMDLGDNVYRYKISFSEKVEESIRSFVGDYQKNPGSVNHPNSLAWCTLEVFQTLKNGLAKIYGIEKAHKMAALLIDYNLPEKLSEKEMFEKGFDGYDFMQKIDDTNNYSLSEYTFNEDGTKTSVEYIVSFTINADETVTTSKTFIGTTSSNVNGLNENSASKRAESKEILDLD